MCKNLRYNSKMLKQSKLTTQELYKICFYDMFLVGENTDKYFVPEKEAGEVANHLSVIISNMVSDNRKKKRN